MTAALQEEHHVKTLRISKDLELPLDAVTQTLAFIARKGGGKTYGAQLLAEEMLSAGAQVVAIDPVGNWYSLRLAADGRGRGREIYVFGGEHGDVPLTPEAGARIAQLVVEKRVSVVLDVSTFRKAERKRFAASFAEELFHRKKAQRSPMHLFLEEAQKLVPQVPEADERQMLGAFEDIVRLGRNYGIGCTMITQRPQSVNKEVLSQTECLVVLQVNGEHERKALEAWVKEANADRQLVGELPGLAVGEAYVWSPSWLRTFKRIRLGKKATFDASATPQVGRAAAAAGKLSPMDVEALRADLQEVVAKAEQDDPKALRRQIAELQRELARKPAAAPPRATAKVEVQVLKDAQVKRLEAALERAGKVAETMEYAVQKVREAALAVDVDLHSAVKALAARPGAPPAPAPRPAAPALAAPRPIAPPAPRRAARAGPPSDGEPQLRAGERRMLEVLARGYPAKRTRAQLGTLAGFTPSGGTFGAYFGVLKRHGLILEEGDGSVSLTKAGLAQVGGAPPPPQTTEEILDTWRRALRAGERAMLDVLVESHPRGLSREELGERAGFAASGGTFGTYLGVLRRNGLVDVRGDEVSASETLFLAHSER
jgi:uncharacterized protein